jgi:hypothetical protein
MKISNRQNPMSASRENVQIATTTKKKHARYSNFEQGFHRVKRIFSYSYCREFFVVIYAKSFEEFIVFGKKINLTNFQLE